MVRILRAFTQGNSGLQFTFSSQASRFPIPLRHLQGGSPTTDVQTPHSAISPNFPRTTGRQYLPLEQFTSDSTPEYHGYAQNRKLEESADQSIEDGQNLTAHFVSYPENKMSTYCLPFDTMFRTKPNSSTSTFTVFSLETQSEELRRFIPRFFGTAFLMETNASKPRLPCNRSARKRSR